MKARSICILSTLGLLALVLATHASHAQGMTPGQAAPPLATLDLTKPGSPRPSAVTPYAAPPAPVATPAARATAPGPALKAMPPAAAKPARVTAKARPAKVKPAKAKPGAVAAATRHKKVMPKTPRKTAKGKPARKPTTQTAIARDN